MPYIPSVRKKTEDGNEYGLDIVSCLLDDRIIFLDQQINDSVATSLIGQLLYLESLNPDEDITIYINSPGGVIDSGMAIYDVMNKIKCPINTVCMGMAASMASFLLCSGSKGHRYALPNSTVMIHQPLGGAQGQATEMEIAVKRILFLREKMYKIMAKNTGKTFEEISKACERDNYLTAEEALQFGLIDKIIDSYPKAWGKEE